MFFGLLLLLLLRTATSRYQHNVHIEFPLNGSTVVGRNVALKLSLSYSVDDTRQAGVSGVAEAFIGVRLCLALNNQLLSTRNGQFNNFSGSMHHFDPQSICKKVSDISGSDSVLMLKNLKPETYTVTVILYDDTLTHLVSSPAKSTFNIVLDNITQSNIDTWAASLQRYQSLLLDYRAGDTPLKQVVRGSGAGIVILAGSVIPLTNAWLLLKSLRRSAIKPWPVEIFHFGEEEIPYPFREHLQRIHGLECHVQDLKALIESRLKIPESTTERALFLWPDAFVKYHLKPFAVLHSRFQEVILLDSDTIVLQDLSLLLNSSQYVKSGALFWRDWSGSKIYSSNPISLMLGLFNGSASMAVQDSSLILLDKARILEELFVCTFLNSDGQYPFFDNNKNITENGAFLVRWLLDGGDKETWHLAWDAWGTYLTGSAYNLTSYHFEDLPPAIIAPKVVSSTQFCGTTFLHYFSVSDEVNNGTLVLPLLLHASLAKRGPVPDYSEQWSEMKSYNGQEHAFMRRIAHTSPIENGCPRWSMDLYIAVNEGQDNNALLPSVPVSNEVHEVEQQLIKDLKELHSTAWYKESLKLFSSGYLEKHHINPIEAHKKK